MDGSWFRVTRARRIGGAMALTAALGAMSGCAVVRQDQIGIKRTLGNVDDEPHMAGAVGFWPGVQDVVTLPRRTVNQEVRLSLPAREGVNVLAEISILYRIEVDRAAHILETAGERYEEVLILPVFRAAAADVSARFYAKDLHSGARIEIEREIRERMSGVLAGRGFLVENVLLKSITLPTGLASAIEEKLQAEQEALRMQFVLLREKQEAERLLIEAQGKRDAQRVLGEALTPAILRYRTIEAMERLAKSPNAKVVVTGGAEAEFLIETD